MDMLLLLKFASVFVFVISLMLLLSWGLKRMGLGTGATGTGDKRRLKVVEYLPIDHRRRLVLVRCDEREHLLMLGPESETVVETGIPAKDKDDHVVAFSRDPRNVRI
jgi:flagellar protein FliO/FliZ